MKLLFTLILMSGCATAAAPTYVNRHTVPCSIPRAAPDVDPALLPFVKEFFFEARKQGATCFRTSRIEFRTQEQINQDIKEPIGRTLGYCTESGLIALNKDAWDTNGLLMNKAVLFHELGHCTLHLDHATENSTNIMTAFMLDEETLAENWALLMDKLFSNNLGLHGDHSDVFFNRHTVQ
jgi:hypothetical protein